MSSAFVAWGYQPHFRAIVSNAAKDLFAELDPDLSAEIFLVGLGSVQVGLPPMFVEAAEPEGLESALKGVRKTLDDETARRREYDETHAILGPAGFAAHTKSGCFSMPPPRLS